MTRNMGYVEFSDFYFSRQPKYGHSKNVLKYPPIGAILRGVLQQPPEGGWDQTKYGHGHTPWVLDQPWYQNRVTRFGHFPLGFEGLANEHLKKSPKLIPVHQMTDVNHLKSKGKQKLSWLIFRISVNSV